VGLDGLGLLSNFIKILKRRLGLNQASLYLYDMKFIKFLIIWISQNLSIPFWMVGHVHLTMNIYHDTIELISSIGMNVLVAIGFWLDWKQNNK
jgi:hypothetical protein